MDLLLLMKSAIQEETALLISGFKKLIKDPIL